MNRDEKDEPIMVRLQDSDALGICRKGLRRMLAQLGYDWNVVRFKGIPIEELEQINDLTVKKVVQQARKRHGK